MVQLALTNGLKIQKKREESKYAGEEKKTEEICSFNFDIPDGGSSLF